MKIKLQNIISRVVCFALLAFQLQSCVPVMVAAAAKSGEAIAKDRSIGQTVDDVKIASAINAKLMRASFKDLYSKVSVKVIRGRVLFTGKIKSKEDGLRAVEIAWKQNNVVSVANELVVTDNPNHFDAVEYAKDTFITTKVKAGLLKTKKVKSPNFTVITISGVVYIFGVARSQWEMEEVARIASKVKGVKKVINYIDLIDDYSEVIEEKKLKS